MPRPLCLKWGWGGVGYTGLLGLPLPSLLDVRDRGVRAALPTHPPSSTCWRTIWKQWPDTCCSSAWPWRILRRWDCKVSCKDQGGRASWTTPTPSPPPTPLAPVPSSSLQSLASQWCNIKTLAIVPHSITCSLTGKNSERETHAKHSEGSRVRSTVSAFQTYSQRSPRAVRGLPA